ncbi:MAG: transcriptional repressor [Proteobacteria bacterium]|nr:transcriptional repressor [Cystobacterineae bacterium]MCL2258793.1 transcriptional repressor [Cystobacterineae bacterium]MCL2313769.1 transcriptional repressor [Pseudomonadota bacterium]
MEAAISIKTVAQLEKLNAHLLACGLKRTRQRDLIATVFFQEEGHISIEELCAKVRRMDARISVATVYRTMRLLAESGLVHPHHFTGGHTRYEVAGEHHDHLICTRCGSIVEFEDKQIETLQAAVARRHDFFILSHKMEIYGLCKDCRALDNFGESAGLRTQLPTES